MIQPPTKPQLELEHTAQYLKDIIAEAVASDPNALWRQWPASKSPAVKRRRKDKHVS